jgi:hypothetical protein
LLHLGMTMAAVAFFPPPRTFECTHTYIHTYIKNTYIHVWKNTYIPSLCTIRIDVLKHLCLLKYVHMYCITCLYGIYTYTDSLT